MKKLLLLILVISSHFCDAQNWQCLQAGVKHYFTNGNGYLRGIRIDSVRTVGSDVVYYPFHTKRGDYIHLGYSSLDSNGGSWLGKKVVQQTDGTFLFDNIWHDTVVIKARANVGDSWVFYNDTTSLFYLAKMISADTMTVLGALDSIKRVLITARNPSGIVTTDLVDSFQIVLSKNYGFVSVFDLYTFPYHKPNTVYGPGMDYFLDYLLSGYWTSFTLTNAGKSIFSLVPLNNPTQTQVYDWNVGDVFENSTFDAFYPNNGNYPNSYYLDSIISKNILTGGVEFGYTGWMAVQHLPAPGPFYDPTFQYPYDTFSTSGLFTISDDLLIDTMVMPEENTQGYFQYYFPRDSSYCLRGDLYRFIQFFGFYSFSEGDPVSITYKTGIGLENYNWNVLGGSPPLIQDTTLLYYVKGGHACGRYTYPSRIYHPAGICDIDRLSFSIFPNPATDELTIKTNTTQPHTITMTNMIGQVVAMVQSKRQEETINVSKLPAGVYNVSVTDESGNRVNERVVVERSR